MNDSDISSFHEKQATICFEVLRARAILLDIAHLGRPTRSTAAYFQIHMHMSMFRHLSQYHRHIWKPNNRISFSIFCDQQHELLFLRSLIMWDPK